MLLAISTSSRYGVFIYIGTLPGNVIIFLRRACQCHQTTVQNNISSDTNNFKSLKKIAKCYCRVTCSKRALQDEIKFHRRSVQCVTGFHW